MKRAVLISLLALLAAPAARASVEEGRARITPWSGDWWSMHRGRMCNGYREDEMSPFRKHDKVTGAHANDWERKNHYDSDYPKWYGHCHAWAAAAISEVEPTHTVHYNGVMFRVGDIKAMLTEGHYDDKATVFGERYTGSGCDFQDIYPDKLWKVMQDYIGTQRLALLMDLDPGVPVWTYPVYGYRIEYHRSDDDSDLYDGEMTLLVTNTTVPPDYVGCLRLEKHYTFQVKMRDGAIIEGTGRWTGHSRDNHPDYAWYPASREQENGELVFSMAQKLADLASDAHHEDSRAVSEGLAAMDDWNRQQGGHEALPARPSHSSSSGGTLMQNPALPDLSARRRRAAHKERRAENRSIAAPQAATVLALGSAAGTHFHLRHRAPT
jgi:hypothetical protein